MDAHTTVSEDLYEVSYLAKVVGLRYALYTEAVQDAESKVGHALTRLSDSFDDLETVMRRVALKLDEELGDS